MSAEFSKFEGFNALKGEHHGELAGVVDILVDFNAESQRAPNSLWK
jgi:hypothetical protein